MSHSNTYNHEYDPGPGAELVARMVDMAAKRKEQMELDTGLEHRVEIGNWEQTDGYWRVNVSYFPIYKDDENE